MLGLLLAVSMVGQGRYTIQPEVQSTSSRYTIHQASVMVQSTDPEVVAERRRLGAAVAEARRQANMAEHRAIVAQEEANKTRKARDVKVVVREAMAAERINKTYQSPPVYATQQLGFYWPSNQPLTPVPAKVRYTYPYRAVYSGTTQAGYHGGLFSPTYGSVCVGGVCR
jgi:hypothetical protein